MMPSLLVLEHGRWSRHGLPGPAGHAVLRTNAAAPVTAGAGPLAGLPADAAGVILLCKGNAFYLAAPAVPSYLNAESDPLMPLHRLCSRDRLTYQGTDGSSIRVWYVQDDQPYRRRDDASLGQMCGYCSSYFAAGEEFALCPGCSEMVHAECLEHGGGKCPRCGAALAPTDEPWLPDGFPGGSEGDDGGE
jgi:hypothetical protein